VALAVAAVSCAALGALLGVAWARLAPSVDLVVAGDGKAYPEGYQPEGFMADDGVAAILCVVAGLVVGVGVVVALRRARGQAGLDVAMRRAAVIVLPLGAIGAGALWFVGTRLGGFELASVLAVSEAGDALVSPLRLRMPGVLVLWPAASALVVFAVAVGDWLAGRVRERRSAQYALMSGE